MTTSDVANKANGAVAAAVTYDALEPRTLPVGPLAAQDFEELQAEIVRLERLKYKQFNLYLETAGLIPPRKGMQWALQKIEGRLCIVEQPAQKEGT